MMSGLSHLHDETVLPSGRVKRPIAHRDIKSKNILLKGNTTSIEFINTEAGKSCSIQAFAILFN